VKPVGFAIVHHHPVGVELRRGVGTARAERRLFVLRRRRIAVELRRRGLVEARLLLEIEQADRLQEAERAEGVGVGGVFGRLEAHLHVALGGEIVDLVGLRLLHEADEIGGVGHVAIVQPERHALLVRIVIEMIDTLGVERRGATLDAVDVVALADQELGEIGAVLAGHPGDERDLAGHAPLLCAQEAAAAAAFATYQR